MLLPQDLPIQLLQPRREHVRFRRLEVRRQRPGARYARAEQGEDGSDFLGRGAYFAHEVREIGLPLRRGCFVGRGGVVVMLREGAGRVGDQGQVLQDVGAGEDDGVVGPTGEFPAESRFPGREGRVLAQACEQGYLLCEDLRARFAELVAG